MQHRIDGFDFSQLEDGNCQIKVQSRIASPDKNNAFLCEYTYTINKTGAVTIDVHGLPKGTWPDYLPRIGLELGLPLEYSDVLWFGRGTGGILQ